MLPPRSLDQSCPESHARCEPSWLSPRRNSCVLPFFQLIFPLSLFSLVALPLMTFPGSMRVITPEGGRERETGGGGGGGVVRVFIECVGVDSQMLNPVRDR